MALVRIEFDWMVDDGYVRGNEHSAFIEVPEEDIESLIDDPAAIRELMEEQMQSEFEQAVRPELGDSAVDDAIALLESEQEAAENAAENAAGIRPAYVRT